METVITLSPLTRWERVGIVDQLDSHGRVLVTLDGVEVATFALRGMYDRRWTMRLDREGVIQDAMYRARVTRDGLVDHVAL